MYPKSSKTHGDVVRKGDSRGVWYTDDDGVDQLTIPSFEYDELDIESPEQRFLTIHPRRSDDDDHPGHIRCELKTVALADAPPFVAIKNARGYKFFNWPIEVNGQALMVTCALGTFLRHLQTKIKTPTVLWVRYVCLRETHPLEQAAFWTREWNDKMYGMATSVMDMSAHNAMLLDQGLLEKVVDRNFKTWKKEWYGAPEQPVLPQTYPVRLGKQCSWEHPTDEHEYVPLDVVMDEIRVMVIIPSADADAPININAGTCPVKSEVTYSALSYRWGTDTQTESVTLNGQRKSIRRSLADTIRAVRHPSSSIMLWIDALSIDQDDVDERNRQIIRMGSIYDSAVSVLSYLGPKTSDSDLALTFIKELQQPMIRMNDDGEWHFGEWGSRGGHDGHWYGENRIKGDLFAQMCAALYKFLTRPYFRRCWVLQEVAWASNPSIAVGSEFGTSWDQLETATCNLLCMLRDDPAVIGIMMRADPDLKSVQPEALAFPRKLAYFRHVNNRGARAMLSGLFPFKPTAPGFLETLIMTRGFECIEPRDKIFSLWSLAKDRTGLVFDIDYSQSIRDVFVSFSRAWMEQHRSLDIIGAAEPDDPTHPRHPESLPSWCPYWPVPSTASCLVRREDVPTRVMASFGDLDGPLYRADGGADPPGYHSIPFTISPDGVLQCTGLILDRVAHIFSAPDPVPPKGLWYPRCDPYTFHRFNGWRADLLQHFQAHGLNMYLDPDQAATAMFHGDGAAAWSPVTAENVDLDELVEVGPLLSEKYVCDVTQSRHVLRYARSYERSQAWEVVKMVLRGRTPFVSEGGYMGLLPSYVVGMAGETGSGWDLAILAGCSAPVLLREREDGTYQLCGTCFVQGWMDGEMIADMSGEEGPVEFWNGVCDAARLSIS